MSPSKSIFVSRTFITSLLTVLGAWGAYAADQNPVTLTAAVTVSVTEVKTFLLRWVTTTPVHVMPQSNHPFD